jgi:FkbM family methyltransferase
METVSFRGGYALNKLTSFQTIAYKAMTHESGTAHYFNDTEFFEVFFSLVLDADQSVIDVGFNIGIQAELYLKHTKGKVFGFEASEAIYQFSKSKFAKQPQVQLFNFAVSNQSGTADFIETRIWGAGSLKYTQGMSHCGVGDDFEVKTVELKRLDDVLEQHSDIGLIKLDIEGAELLALDGARELLQRNRPYIVMEYCHNALSFELNGKPIVADTLYDFATELGYKVYNIYGICLSNKAIWNTSILKDTADVFLIPEEKHVHWCSELLPLYQYRIFDKMLAEIESNTPHNYLWLTALPSRIYEVINTSSEQQAKAYLTAISQELQQGLSQRDDIFLTAKLTRRGEVLLALVFDKQVDQAYQLGMIKQLSAQQLAAFEKQI